MNERLKSEDFELICEARDCYNENGNNDYSALEELKESRGIFAYATDNEVLYIGMSEHSTSGWILLYDRVSQCLRLSDSGSPFKELSNEEFHEVLDSSIYTKEMNDSDYEKIEKSKNKALKQYKPKFNKRIPKEEDL